MSREERRIAQINGELPVRWYEKIADRIYWWRYGRIHFTQVGAKPRPRCLRCGAGPEWIE